ncbi:MAG: phytanoyl-CoA dioxygenase family protein [Abditibacteriales bacterium]|nr:phytanoyl-CoA dioxygenase family protein [Abditibacteriales bacterium]MDW8365469.1 phytanoyl-CoA dioxygenase family protein [Abditibacteriales bacterium]
MPMQLTPEQLNAYQQDGYVVVEDLVTPAEVAALRQRVWEYTHGGRPWGNLKVQVEPRVQRGELRVEHPGDGIRKIDYLVQEDDLFRQLGLHENIVSIIEQILGPDIKMFRNSLLLKPPEVGSQKGWHQDSPYWPIGPMDLCSCWFPLDDATLENGCMWAIPGWHKKGPLPHVHVTDDNVIAEGAYDEALGVAIPMRAGSGLFFHSLLPHYTAPNRSNKWRRAIALSYMSARSRYTGPGESPQYFHVKGNTYPGCVR